MSQEQLYTIKEFAELVGVSRQSIYKALNQTDNQLVNYLTTIDNQKKIRESALYEVYGLQRSQPDRQPESTKFTDDIIEILKSQIELCNTQLESYKRQLEQKDEQIASLQKLLEHQQKLFENQQKLQLEHSPKLMEMVAGVNEREQEQPIIVPEQKQPEETTQAAGTKTKKLFSWFKRK